MFNQKNVKITKQEWNDFIRANVEHAGKALYDRLIVVCVNMNIDLIDLLNNTSDYHSFWSLVSKYYNDYVDMEDYEDASN